MDIYYNFAMSDTRFTKNLDKILVDYYDKKAIVNAHVTSCYLTPFVIRNNKSLHDVYFRYMDDLDKFTRLSATISRKSL
jgi:hypothetical protein